MKLKLLLIFCLAPMFVCRDVSTKKPLPYVGLNSVLKDPVSRDPAGPCPVHPTPQPLPTPLPDIIVEAITNLTALAKSLLDTVPGVVVAFTYQDQVLLSKGFGVKDRNKPDPPDADTIFRIGSISKVFAVLTLFQLLEQGKVKSLDDPLSDYCPQFSIKNPYKYENEITLRMLASQLSGLPNNPPCSDSAQDVKLCQVGTDEVLKRLSEQYVVEPSWTRPSYSNLAYALLGHCLMKKVGPLATYEDYVQKNILDPLNMTDTGFNFTESIKSRMATGYNPDGTVAPLIDLGWAAPAGQMYSTVNDLLKFARFFVTNGEYGGILKPDLVKEMGLPAFLDYDGRTAFGTPWEIIIMDSYVIRCKGGEVSGYMGFLSYLPDLEISYIVLMNSAVPPNGLIYYPYSILVQSFGAALAKLQPNYPAPPDLKVYIGSYFAAGLGTNITIFQYESGLGIQFSQTFAAYLSYYDDLLLQLKFPDGLVPCITYEVMAINNEWLYFEPVDSSGRSPAFSMPGVYGTKYATRID